MKPRRIISEITLPNGSVLGLHEHDGRHFLMCDAIQICGPSSRVSEREMARLACAPYRPARQPKIMLVGLGLGEGVNGVAESLLQKRATFHVVEPVAEVVRWNREVFPDGVFASDSRTKLHTDPSPTKLAGFDGSLHGILLHTDTAPLSPNGRLLFEEHRWLTAAYDALQEGGLLTIASSSKIPKIERTLEKVGFVVASHEIDAVPNARRPKHHFLWLARKGKFTD